MGLFSRRRSNEAVQVAGPRASGSGSANRYASSERQAVAGASSSSSATSRQNTQSSQSSFVHEPLQQDEIRLFVLRRGRRHDPIQIQLQNYPVTRRPNYTALSFTWGDRVPANSAVISVAGRDLHVTQTLVAALRGIRLVDRDRIMWADQVCIDQGRIAEKTEQVRKMSIIYPQASEVTCWLGEDDGTVELAFRALRQWAAACGDGRGKEKLRAELVAKTVRSSDTGAHDALQKLFKRPWWRRAWTLQEVCPSATNRPVLLCGQHQLSWFNFYHACYAMFNYMNWDERMGAVSAAVAYVLPMLRTSWASKEDLRLSQLIPVVARREASDQRDKVFALLGMTAAAGLDYPPADYTLSVDQVCIKYTRAIIQVDRSLDILLSVTRSQPHERLPSWSIKIDRLLGEDVQLDGHSATVGVGKHRFNATLHGPPMVGRPRTDFDQILQLYGAPSVDTVRQFVSIQDVLDILCSGPVTWNAILDRTASFCSRYRLPDRYGPTQSSMLEAVLNTLSASDFYLLSQRPYVSRHPEWDALYAAYQEFLSSQRTRTNLRIGARSRTMSHQELMTYTQERFSFRRVAGSQTQARLPEHDGTTAWLGHKLAGHLLSDIRRRTGGRCMFVTNQGYIGLGSRNARAGDRVCLLFGSSVPFMLRPVRTRVGSAWQLVDEAYCEGIMMGEGLREYVGRGGLRAPSGGWTRYALV